jgi:hypothetical protein
VRRGGCRSIVAPKGALDVTTKNLYRGFAHELPYVAPPHVHGFVKGRSIITNAAQHLDKDCVLRVDLRRYFPSISTRAVVDALRAQGLDEAAGALGGELTTIRGHLPIGLSTSPYLSNLVFESTDVALAEFAAKEGLSHTRYVDDLIFSGEVTDRHLAELTSILERCGWAVNARKTRFMRRGGPQYVTGLYVGCADRPRIPRRIKRRLRWIAHMIDAVGYESFMEEFGGNEYGLQPVRLIGWARHVCAIEPDLGFPLLKYFDEELPSGYLSSAERQRYEQIAADGYLY